MVNAIYGGFGGIDCVIATVGVTETTQATIAGFSLAAIGMGGAGFVVPLMDPTTGAPVSLSSLWSHFVRMQGDGYSRSNVEWRDSSGVAHIRLFSMTSPDLWCQQLQILVAGTWTNLGGLMHMGYGGNNTVDLYTNLTSTGKIALFQNGTEIFEVNGDYSALGTINSVWFGDPGGPSVVQQGIFANFNTIGHTVRQRAPLAAGAKQDWVGTYANVSKFPYNDSTYISSGVTGNIDTFTGTVLSATPAGQVIKGTFIGARCRIDTSGPQNVTAVMEIGTTQYAPAYSIKPMTLGYSGGINIFMNNPATGAAWANITEANCNFGVKSQA